MRCKRCHRQAPRSDGIPCSECAPGDYSPEAAIARHQAEMAKIGRATGETIVEILVRLAHRSEDGWGHQ